MSTNPIIGPTVPVTEAPVTATPFLAVAMIFSNSLVDWEGRNIIAGPIVSAASVFSSVGEETYHLDLLDQCMAHN